MSFDNLNQSADVQQLDRVIDLLEQDQQLTTMREMLKTYRGVLDNKDHYLQVFEPMVVSERPRLMREYRTVIYNLGRQMGMTFFAQLLCHKKTIVLTVKAPPDGFQQLRGYPMMGDARKFINPDELYRGVEEATVHTDPAEFLKALSEGDFESAVISGSRSLMDFDHNIDRSEFLDEIGTHLRGDLPFIHVIY